jgi:hypothetical protein
MPNPKLELTWIGKETRPASNLASSTRAPRKVTTPHIVSRTTTSSINKLIFGDNLLTSKPWRRSIPAR